MTSTPNAHRFRDRRNIAAVVLIALIQGVSYLLLLPPWQHYDEPTHFEYAWLIANRNRLPHPGDGDLAMRREVAASMIEHNFYGETRPDLRSDNDPFAFPLLFSELEHPPGYYILVSLPLRLIRHLDMTKQLYAARCVSLVLFLALVASAAGVARELTSPGHPLRWAVPLVVVLIPPVADIMTAVNNDVGAICIFSVFLWGAVRTMCRGVSLARLLWIIGTAVGAVWVKNTAATALLFVPLVLVLTIWRQRGWRWRWLVLGITTATVLGIVAAFDWGDAAFWYRWWGGGPPQAFATRASTTAEEVALTIDALPNIPSRNLMNPVLTQDVVKVAGQTVTVGGWIWAEEAITLSSPGLILSPQGTPLIEYRSEPISVTTVPTFVHSTHVIPENIGTLYYALWGSKLSAEQEAGTRVYLRDPILVAGTFPVSSVPWFHDDSARTGIWAGQPFTNLVRNASAEQGWPRLRPWVERSLTKVIRRSPAHLLAALFDWQQNEYSLVHIVAPSLLFGFFGRFAWNHVHLPGNITLWLWLFLGVALVAVLGCMKWLLQVRGRSKLLPPLLFLTLAALAIWAMTFAWPLPYRASKLPIPSARYTYPAVIPVVLALVGGWWMVWPRRYRASALSLFVCAIAALNGLAIWTIWSYYQHLPGA